MYAFMLLSIWYPPGVGLHILDFENVCSYHSFECAEIQTRQKNSLPVRVCEFDTVKTTTIHDFDETRPPRLKCSMFQFAL